MDTRLSALGLEEAAEKLRLTATKVKGLIRKNKLSGYFDGKEWFVYLYSVENYEKEKKINDA